MRNRRSRFRPVQIAQSAGGIDCAAVTRNAHESTLMDSWAFV